MSTKVVRQTVTVGEGGRIQLELPELAPGTQAEVTVTTETPLTDAEVAARLAAFDALVESLNLDEARAEAWIREIREEREAREDKLLAEWERASAPRSREGHDPP